MPTHKLYLKYKKPHGFTVVELLVATTVFVIVVTAIIQLLFMFLRGPLQQIRQKQLEEQLTYATSEMSHYIRQSKIDYSASTSTSLQLISADNVTRQFSYDDANHTIVFTQNDQFGEGVANFTGANVEIQSLKFFIYPAADPTVVIPGEAALNNQPAVVMVIQAQRKDDANIKARFQILTTSRYYAR